MALLKTSGIVIKQVNYSESDKILTIFTKDHGKISAVAKGARKTKNRFLSCAQLFCYSDFVYYQGSSMAYINQCELRESFYNLRMDLNKLTYSSYIIELINAALEEQEKEEKIFSLLIHTLNHLANSNKIDLDLILLAFQTKLMALTGFAPHMDNCVACGKEIKENAKISPKLGGLICHSCYKNNPYSLDISEVGIETLLFTLHRPLSQLSELKVHRNIIKQLQKIMNTYVSVHLEKAFYSLDFLNIIDNMGYMSNKGDEING